MTVNPSVTTLSTVKSKKDQGTGAAALIVVQSTNITATQPVAVSNSPLGVTDAFFGVPELENDTNLPDLGTSREITIENVLNETHDPHSTEEELDAADTLLSLSNVRDNLNLNMGTEEFDDIDKNAMLMPIGGTSNIEDLAPEPLRLGQVEVDEGIAQMLAIEEHDKLNSLSGIQNNEKPTALTSIVETGNGRESGAKSATLSGVQNTFPTQVDLQCGDVDSQTGEPVVSTEVEDVHKGARLKVPVEKSSEVVTKKGSRGAFKSQLFGLRRAAPKDRSYWCKICDVTKRSIEDLNEHHRRRHGKQKCEVCGKQFNLATTLTHHMYSHFPRKFNCEKCDFHCRFQSELDAHKITHRETPSFQCMYPNCGRWFKCKGELTLHVEVHNKLWYDCSKCDFSTKLVKYLKEHEKSHKKELPYSCNLCGKCFL